MQGKIAPLGGRDPILEALTSTLSTSWGIPCLHLLYPHLKGSQNTAKVDLQLREIEEKILKAEQEELECVNRLQNSQRVRASVLQEALHAALPGMSCWVGYGLEIAGICLALTRSNPGPL